MPSSAEETTLIGNAHGRTAVSNEGKQTAASREEESRSLPRLFLAGAGAACIAESVTLPLDTAKVRLQLQSYSFTRGSATVAPVYGNSPFHTLRAIVKSEGLRAPFKGLVPGLHRQIIFTGLRLGLYEEVKQLFSAAHGGVEEPLRTKVAAALAVSAAGICLANPSDVVKVRFQAHKGPTRAQQGYQSTWAAYRRIAAEEGVLGGLYKGFIPNLLRNCVISATEIVTYDVTKRALLRRLELEEALPVHLAAALTAGFAATCVGSPADVVGTRIMTDRSATRAGLLPYVARMVREEGLTSLWKGFLPNFARIGSFNLVLWISYERFKTLL